MVTPQKLEEIANGYVGEALSDYVGLWQIIVRARHELGISAPADIKAIVLQVVGIMLSNGLEAVALGSSGSGCIPWEIQDRDYILKRISSEWDALGRDPSVGDIVWFNNTDTGVRS